MHFWILKHLWIDNFFSLNFSFSAVVFKRHFDAFLDFKTFMDRQFFFVEFFFFCGGVQKTF